MDTTGHLLFLVVFLTKDYITSAGRIGSCTIPEKYHGRWYRNALGNMGIVNIKETTFEGIGDCVAKRNKDHYFIHDKEESCYKCILIIERDNNVIQYRKGDCIKQGKERPNVSFICDQVKVESFMITLVRVGASPIPCPLGNLRGISYNNNTASYCNNPRSQLQTCASTSKMKLQFGKCEDIPGTHETEFVAECLSEWKSGSDRFIYTSISNPQQEALVFRCFKYEYHGPEILVEMSTDASCRFHMKMRLLEEAMPDPDCLFPTWIQAARWLDSSGKAIHNVQNGGRELYSNRLKDSADTGRTTHRYSCLKKIEGNQSDTYLSVRSIHKCSASFQCLKLQKNTDGVIQMTESSKYKAEPKDCASFKKHQHNVAILLRDTEEQACPIKGSFRTGDCTSHAGYSPMTSLHIGCGESSIFTVYSERKDDRTDSYRCLKEWKLNGNQFILGRDKKTNAFVCLVHGNINGQETLIRNNNCELTSGHMCTVTDSRDSCLGRGRHKVNQRTGRTDIQSDQAGYLDNEDSYNVSDPDNSATFITYSSNLAVLYVLTMTLTKMGTFLGLLVC